LTEPPSSFLVRRRRAVRRRARRLLVALLVVALIGAAVWTLGFSTVLTVRTVAVQGNSLLSSDDVVAAAAVPMGTPLVRVDTAAVAARVGALPAVGSATVVRRWPGTIEVRVKERAIVYQIPVGSTYVWISADGVGFNHSDDPQPVITAEVAMDDQRLLADIATVVLALPDELKTGVTSITAGSRDSITLRLDGGRQVMWGGAGQSDLKAQVVVPLLTVPGQEYDVSSPGHPAVR